MRISEPALKKILKDKDMTIEEFGSKLEMTRRGVYDLMKRSHVKESMVKKMCEALGVNREAFLLPEDTTQFQATQLSTYMLQLQSENVGLRKELAEKNERIIELQEKIMSLQDKAYNLSQKIIATGTGVKKNS